MQARPACACVCASFLYTVKYGVNTYPLCAASGQNMGLAFTLVFLQTYSGKCPPRRRTLYFSYVLCLWRMSCLWQVTAVMLPYQRKRSHQSVTEFGVPASYCARKECMHTHCKECMHTHCKVCRRSALLRYTHALTLRKNVS